MRDDIHKQLHQSLQCSGHWLYEHYTQYLDMIEHHKDCLCEALNEFDHWWAKNDSEMVAVVVEKISTIISEYEGVTDYAS